MTGKKKLLSSQKQHISLWLKEAEREERWREFGEGLHLACIWSTVHCYPPISFCLLWLCLLKLFTITALYKDHPPTSIVKLKKRWVSFLSWMFFVCFFKHWWNSIIVLLKAKKHKKYHLLNKSQHLHYGPFLRKYSFRFDWVLTGSWKCWLMWGFFVVVERISNWTIETLKN